MCNVYGKTNNGTTRYFGLRKTSGFFQTNSNTKDEIQSLMKSGSLKRPNAAVGQSGLQALYETMFRNYGIMVGQVLVTKPDFYYEQTRQQLFATINELMQLNIIPIINTNDAVSPPPQQVLCTLFLQNKGRCRSA